MKQNTRVQFTPYTVSLLTALITFITYLPALQNGFVTWDDNIYIYDNEHIRSLNFDFLKWSLTDFHTGNWHPLTWLSHALDYAVWGMNPLGHHLTSILFHCLNTFLVTLLAVRLVEEYQSRKDREGNTVPLSSRSMLLVGFVTGILFGIHPIHVESVAWISERKDVLYAFFFLLGLLAYIRYTTEQNGAFTLFRREGKGRTRYIAVLMFFVLALISKPMAVTFPLILIVLDWFPLARLHTGFDRKRAIIEKLPFFIIEFVFSTIAIIAQKSAHAVAQRVPVPIAAKIMNAFKGLAGYLGNLVWPTDLMPFYPHPYWQYPVLTSSQYILPVLITICISAFCIFIMKKQKIWLAVWACYVIMLIPVLGFIQLGAQGMADRYAYLPSVGPFLIVGIATGLARRKFREGTNKTTFVLMTAALCVYIFLLSGSAIKQMHFWKDGVTLWTHELDVLRKESSTDTLAYLDAYSGLAYADMRNEEYRQAIDAFSQVVLLKPDAADAYQQRAIAYARLGNFEDATKDFSAAIAINPAAPQLYYNRGTAFARQGFFLKAVQDLTKAISISKNPKAEYYLNRGLALKKLGRVKEGDRDIAEAKRIRDGNSNDMNERR